jgi:prepilin-type N-terminal cleavage/methylation domain-containing protein
MIVYRLIDRRGVTLLEMMVAVAIIGIISAFAVPSYLITLPLRRLKADAVDIANNMKYAKMQAVKRNGDVGVYFYPDKGAYCVFLDANGNNQFDGATEVIRGDMDLRRTVSFDRGGSWTVSNNRVIFSPDGSTTDASNAVLPDPMTMVLVNSTGEVRNVQVAKITGRIRITKP